MESFFNRKVFHPIYLFKVRELETNDNYLSEACWKKV